MSVLMQDLNDENEKLNDENEKQSRLIEQLRMKLEQTQEELQAERQARAAAEAECDELSRQLLSSQDRLSAELLAQEWVSVGDYHIKKSAITVIENLTRRVESLTEVKCRINGEGGPVLAMSADNLLEMLQPPDRD